MARVVEAFLPGTRVVFRYGGRQGTVVRHEARMSGGSRRIRVLWDDTPRARSKETTVNSLNLKEIHCDGAQQDHNR